MSVKISRISSKTMSSTSSGSKTSNSKPRNSTKSVSKSSSSKSISTSKTVSKISISKPSSSKPTSPSKANSQTSSSKSLCSPYSSRTNGQINSTTSNTYTGNSNVHSNTLSTINRLKYVVDAAAIYTNQGKKSSIANETTCLGVKLPKDHIPGMPSDDYRKAKEYLYPKYNGKTPAINKMLDNLEKDKSLKLTKDQKNAMLCTAEKLLNDGYDAKFVAGVLANVMHEGTPGKFESSYFETHPENKPDYLEYMDRDFDYGDKYSGKTITDVGIQETIKLQNAASKKTHTTQKNGKGEKIVYKFGLGMCQFTGSRTSDLLEAYQEFYKRTGENNPTKEQCLEIEIDFMIKELKSENYKRIYSLWEKGNKTAYTAGSMFCKYYERPKDLDVQAIERGNNAKKIYNIMKK